MYMYMYSGIYAYLLYLCMSVMLLTTRVAYLSNATQIQLVYCTCSDSQSRGSPLVWYRVVSHSNRALEGDMYTVSRGEVVNMIT